MVALSIAVTAPTPGWIVLAIAALIVANSPWLTAARSGGVLEARPSFRASRDLRGPAAWRRRRRPTRNSDPHRMVRSVGHRPGAARRDTDATASELSVSYEVTALVSAACLPETMKRRPEAKGVLFALADKCVDTGMDAWPSVATIAAEVELGPRTVHKVLKSLQSCGLIAEQAPPRQHRPRTWRLNLDLLRALSGKQQSAALRTPDLQRVAHLPTVSEVHSDAQDRAPGPHISDPDAQNRTSGPQHVADDPVLLNRPLNGPLKRTCGARAASFFTKCPDRAAGEPDVLSTRRFCALRGTRCGLRQACCWTTCRLRPGRHDSLLGQDEAARTSSRLKGGRP